MRILITLLYLFNGPIAAQEVTFDYLTAYFTGHWNSLPEACIGIGKADRDYQLLVEGKFMQVANTAYFTPDSANQAGNNHYDWGVFSYDSLQQRVMLREFNSEGFVIRYSLDHFSDDLKKLVFISNAIENLSPGWKARLTITLIKEDTFDELFEVAAPGGEYQTYIKSRWVRQ